MRRFIVIAMTAALAVSLLALPASAKGQPGFTGDVQPNVECLHAGQNTLKSLGLFSAAARGEVDYALIDANGPGIPSLGLPGGLISIDLGDEAKLPISTVFKLHLDPATSGVFAWCNA